MFQVMFGRVAVVAVMLSFASAQVNAEPENYLQGEEPTASAAQDTGIAVAADAERKKVAAPESASASPHAEPEPAPPKPVVADTAALDTGADNETAETVPAAKQPTYRAVTIVAAGDTGFGSSGARVSPVSGIRQGARYPFKVMSRGIAGLIDGDINFANLETVVTDSNGLRPLPKAFNFRTHPAGVRHLIDIGFNLFSLANNHAIDYGRAGVAATLSAMQTMPTDRVLASAGLGANLEDALTPRKFAHKGFRFAFSAIGIGAGGARSRLRPTDNRPGQLSYSSPYDYPAVSERLGSVGNAYRILSVHTGAERSVRPRRFDVRRMRDLSVVSHGVDLVIGHHAHVVQGLQIVDGRLILYGLGNFLHPGMANMARFGRCRDYGLVARVHLLSKDDGPLQLAAVEAVPITNMHVAPRQMSPAVGRKRIAVLNGLARRLDDVETGAQGVRFHVRQDGTGLYCGTLGSKLPTAVGGACRQLGQATAVNARAVSCGSAAPVRAVRYRKRSYRRYRGYRRRAANRGAPRPRWQRNFFRN
ncbi:MAG: CapA family protein [Pseudomonadota bacterium]